MSLKYETLPCDEFKLQEAMNELLSNPQRTSMCMMHEKYNVPLECLWKEYARIKASAHK